MRKQVLGLLDRFCERISRVEHQLGVAATIIGPGSVVQLSSSVVHVPDISLSEHTLENLDGIFPPCGEAPEAYAW